MAHRNITTIARILHYGSKDVMLESSCKPQLKVSTPSAIKVLKKTAFHHRIVSLSANQIGLDQRVFVCLKDRFLIPGKWRQYQNLQNQQQYEAIINPIEKYSSNAQICAFEECPSFEGIRFKVWAPQYINMEFIKEDNLQQTIQQKLTGFKCRVWDHETRHLQGLLPIQQKICKYQFELLSDYKNCYDNIQQFQELKTIQNSFKKHQLEKLQKQIKSGQYKSKHSSQDLASLKELMTSDQSNSKFQLNIKTKIQKFKQSKNNSLKNNQKIKKKVVNFKQKK